MTGALRECSWPMSGVADAMAEVARLSGVPARPLDPVAAHDAANSLAAEDHERFVGWVADRIGLEATPVHVTASSVEALLRSGGPALVRYREAGEPRLLLLRRATRGHVQLVTPDLRLRRVAVPLVADAVCAAHEAALRPEIDSLLAAARVSASRIDRVRRLLARERIGDAEVARAWLVRLPPTAPFDAQLREAGVPRRLVMMLAVFAAIYGLEIAGWGVIGAAAIDGRLDGGWLAAWVLLILSLVPFQVVAGWLDATLALDVGRLIKTRLLAGALRMDPDRIRREGVGHLLGRVIESQAFESLALNSGLGSVVAVLQLVFAAWVLVHGAAPLLHLALLAGWVVVTAGAGIAYGRRLAAWTGERLQLTHALVERMVGHQTTLVQESPARRDAEQDGATAGYVQASARLDAAAVPFLAGIPSGWTFLAVLALTPAFLSGGVAPAALAISLGGVLMAGRAFLTCAGGLSAAASAAVAWQQIGPLFSAGGGEPGHAPFVPARELRAAARAAELPLVDAEAVTFRHHGREIPVLDGASLTVRRGDRLLIEGPSGGGKSTFASMLAGLRTPDGGMVCVNGLDRFTVGDAWHRIVAAAPQFHENHLLSGTLAFNLLMGRTWPASDEDLAAATEMCMALGLGDLLARMPAGLMQMVGETGWQLSHGERSRVFLARALLQGADMTVFDESFAALDPESLETCLAAVLQRAPTVAVIAHP